MNLVDIVILLLLVLSAILGISQWTDSKLFFACRADCRHCHCQLELQVFCRGRCVKSAQSGAAEAICFCLIALAVMLVASLLGMLMKGLIHGVGLGWLDSNAGLIFGLLRGALLVTLCIVTLAAFFPDTRWLGDAQLSRYFLGSGAYHCANDA